MRFKYLAILATVSVLNLGFVAGCSNPGASDTTTPKDTKNQVNPCAAKDKTNPCAAKDKTNPCAAKDKANPCAAKNKTN